MTKSWRKARQFIVCEKSDRHSDIIRVYSNNILNEWRTCSVQLTGLWQTLSDNIRLSYCRLWQSILRRDEFDMKEHSRRLGIGKMYPIFICIVTGRSWDAVTQGVDQTAVSKSEVCISHCQLICPSVHVLPRVDSGALSNKPTSFDGRLS